MTKNELIKHGERADLIRFEKNKIYYVQSDQRFPYTPEEEVRIEAYLKLVLEYKYPPQRITFEHQVKMGSSYKRIDIAIFEDNQQIRPFIITECKREDVGKSTFDEAIEQAKSYDKQLYCDYLWVTSGSKNAYFKTQHSSNGRSYVSLTNIPKFTAKDKALYKVTEYGSIGLQTVKNFYQAFIQPQFKKEWMSKWLFFSAFFLVVGFALSWFHTQFITPFVVHKTKWLYKISFKELYWVIPVLSTCIVTGILKKHVIPDNMVDSRGKSGQRKMKSLYLFACFLIATPSFLITSSLFGLETFCNKCCAEQWDCWWSYAHFKTYEKSYQFLEYFVPYSTTVLAQGFAILIVGWSFKAFAKINA